MNDLTHYEEERKRYSAAFAEFDAVRRRYRARQCGDAEFLAAKKIFDAAQAALDIALSRVEAASS